MRGSAITESRLHDVVAKAAQVIGGPNLFCAVNGLFLLLGEGENGISC